jgi:hypothetical protein
MHETQLIFSATFPSISGIILSHLNVEIIIRVGNVALATPHRITRRRGSSEAGKVCAEEASRPHLQTSTNFAIPFPVPPLRGNVASARDCKLKMEGWYTKWEVRNNLQARNHNEPEFQTPNKLRIWVRYCDQAVQQPKKPNLFSLCVFQILQKVVAVTVGEQTRLLLGQSMVRMTTHGNVFWLQDRLLGFSSSSTL